MKNRMALKSELNYVPDDAYFKSKVINWKNQSKKRSFVDEQVKQVKGRLAPNTYASARHSQWSERLKSAVINGV